MYALKMERLNSKMEWPTLGVPLKFYPGYDPEEACFEIIISIILVNIFGQWTLFTGQVSLGVGSWPSNRATEGSNPKGTRLYFVILLKNVEIIFDWH